MEDKPDPILLYPIAKRDSFKDYKGEGIIEKLVANGFYHDKTKGATHTRCFHCWVVKKDWTKQSDIYGEHKKLSPCCDAVLKVKPYHPSDSVQVEEIQPRHIEERQKEILWQLNLVKPKEEILNKLLEEYATNPLREQSIMACNASKNPQFPAYISNDNRFKSFINWTKKTQTIADMVNAGFMYTNDRDKVQCFQCGVKIVDWEPNDIPLDDHKKHSEKCEYMAYMENISILRNMGYSNEVIKNALTTTNLEKIISTLCDSVEDNLCTICMDEKSKIIFIPCGHMVTCEKCSPSINECCLCRRNITQKVLGR
jgi:hypothetical protein